MPKMSWSCEVIADNSGKWAGNALRFASKKECDAYARDLFSRWTSVTKYRSKRTYDAVNYRWENGKGAVPLGGRPS